ncbi:DUF4149 domain-containing protein [Pseudoduganella sp. FT26W]|jgi:hypothetical protein|uniref:DUF4149 domain-containing protein n=2 Tax=Duganella TaxID=75654 RepID=A0A6L5QNJ6_9BURK|nr:MULTISPECIES: DUF4149 domain-containing protein [Duganella]MRW86635.1 DUF4149 domain-containing protein [Duganella aquatilis]MRX10501.1 DUF4149 domain-containing protein [Duganella alba]MRX18121.1 DUF4149 domain-containing protein [Duganella alba]
MLLARTRLLVATLWAGSLWAVGYLAAPTLFATLSDRVLAGTLAGQLFTNQAWLSIACALVMLVLLWATQTSTGGIFAGPAANMAAKSRRTLLIIVLVMLACTLVSHFGLQPMMATLRAAAGPGGVMEGAAKNEFGILHGISSVIYLVQSLLAAWLVVKQ